MSYYQESKSYCTNINSKKIFTKTLSSPKTIKVQEVSPYFYIKPLKILQPTCYTTASIEV